ncbi:MULTISPECIES: diiron oxygenase [Streptomyces]|uniref:Aminobenzoate oxygenase n=1 Tax=Streptomyces luteosporeus TaxID=173856 RepID=A0ABN3TLP5_9ACTN
MTATGPGRDWYERAGVRSDPRRVLAGELDEGRLFFPPDLVPCLAHPAVAALPPERHTELLARHLYHYLGFTAQFETRVVNRATDAIAGGRSGLDLPTATRLDAYRIYVDEGYHSLYSLDVVDQVSRASGIAPAPYDFAPFLRRLDDAGARALPGERRLAQLLQVVVFETLITAILCDVPKDERVLTLVRDVVRDHARDEGWHHAFFSGFFRDLWAGQDAARRGRIARCLPELIRSSLLPDLRPVRASLTAAGLTPRQAEEVVHDTYPAHKVDRDVRTASRHAVRLFTETGVLDADGGRTAFAEARLVDP